MLIEDYLSQTESTVAGLQCIIELINDKLCESFGYYKKADALDEYREIKGIASITIATMEHMIRIRNQYDQLVEEEYKKSAQDKDCSSSNTY